ncbi:YhcN/YlaJ family sporulation lipoprotein [Anaerobacillus sp. MEB173]|uniref:YhcN/YlaJ family sporulation lipoprotein n=1 Tax=Anaerobacillus sp. MEB173 TaxID=3383345 RepID=UPI003F91152A
MKKLAISISAATLIMGTLVGCGAGQQGYGTDNNRHGGTVGLQTTQQQDRGYFGWNRAGEGPITDMVTRDDRPGRGFNNVTDRNRTGMTGFRGNRTGTFAPYGTTRQSPGVQSPHVTGRTNQGAGTGLFGERRGDTNMFGGRQGTTGFGTNRGNTNFGANHGFGRNETTGWFGTNRGNQGLGTNRGATGFGTNRGGTGITGDRPGMVDNAGTLRGARTNMTGSGIQRHEDNYWPQGNETARQGNRALGNRGTTGLQQGTTGQRGMNYHKDYDGQTAQRIASRVNNIENVNDARVIVNDDTILVGVDTDGRNSQNVEQKIRQTVQGMADGKQVRVVTDRDEVNQIRTADDRLRGGTAFEEVGATLGDMVGDLGRMFQRPFERSR